MPQLTTVLILLLLLLLSPAKANARLQDLLQLRELHNDVVRIRKFHRDEDTRVMWKSIKDERRIVLDCPSDMVVELLNASTEFDLTSQYNVSRQGGSGRERESFLSLFCPFLSL